MVRLQQSVRIHDDETLEPIGKQAFKPNQVIIAGPNEPVFTFKEWTTTILVGMVLLVIGCFIIAAQHGRIRDLRQERDMYVEILSTATTDHNVELLAGKYATSRSSIPKDRDEIYRMCVESGAKHPEVIMAQLIIESASGTSDVYRNSNNLYGMKRVSSKGRPTLQIPDVDYYGYGKYLNWQHSILDRVLWDKWVFRKTGIPDDVNEYLNKIDGIYAEDPGYVQKIKSIIQEWAPKTDSIRSMITSSPEDTLKNLF